MEHQDGAREDGVTSLIFSTSTAPLSRAIRALSRSEASHCGIGLRIDGVDLVADASLLGVEMVERSRWLRGKTLVLEFIFPPLHAPTTAYVMGELGRGYDYSGMLGYLPIYLARWFGRVIRNPWASPTRYVCSEFVVRGMLQRLPLRMLADSESCDPEALMQFCREADYARVT